MSQHLLRGSRLDQAAPLKHGNAVSELRDEREVVRDVEGCSPAPPQHLPDGRQHLDLRGDIKRRRGLV